MQFRITRERCPDTVEDYQKGCLDRELDRLFHLDWSLNYLLDDVEKKEGEPKHSCLAEHSLLYNNYY